MNQRAERAVANFKEGYNCCQSVVLSFADELGFDRETALRLASSFGGGMGRLREVCGAVSGMFFVVGLLKGYSDPKAKIEKAEHYARVQELARRFKERNGSIICRELLGLKKGEKTEPTPDDRNEEYYKLRPCEKTIYDAAEILDEFLKEEEQ